MLHMLVNTHSAEDCAFRGPEEEKLLAGAFERFESRTGDLSIVGSWVNRASHEAFALVDAPNAHEIERALLEAGVVGRTHTRILPVVQTQDAIPDR